MLEPFIYELKHIKKSFPGVTVFDDLNFDLRPGEVHCICGENGAGKSTLIKILSGAYTPDSGEMYYEGKKIEGLTPRKAIEMGIMTIYQEHMLFPNLTVRENLFCGNEILKKNGTLDANSMREKTIAVLHQLRSDISPDAKVANLTSGEQKTVEIARGLTRNAKILILDEPTASFSNFEIKNLLQCIRELVKKNISVIYISHHLEEVFQIADRITVIRDGQKISTGKASEYSEQRLISDMVGRDVSMFYHREKVTKGEIVFETHGITGNGDHNCSLHVRSGEVLGLYGMVGSGRTELADMLFGKCKRESGSIRINNKDVDIRSPIDAIRNKMCYITEDRQGTGLFLQHSIERNITISYFTIKNSVWTKPGESAGLSRQYIQNLRIKTPGASQKVVNLSGGNQQKVVLAKWFATQGDIFIFDEPTRGVDIVAREEIYKLMVELLKQKKAIIMISSDMPEAIAMSDRIMVMRDGRIVGEIAKEDFSEEKLLKYSIGGNAANGNN